MTRDRGGAPRARKGRGSRGGPRARARTTARRAKARPGSGGRTSLSPARVPRRFARTRSTRRRATSVFVYSFSGVFSGRSQIRSYFEIHRLRGPRESARGKSPSRLFSRPAFPAAGLWNPSETSNRGFGRSVASAPGPGRGQACSMTSAVVLAEATKTDVDSAPVSEVRRDPRNGADPGSPRRRRREHSRPPPHLPPRRPSRRARASGPDARIAAGRVRAGRPSRRAPRHTGRNETPSDTCPTALLVPRPHPSCDEK